MLALKGTAGSVLLMIYAVSFSISNCHLVLSW